MSLRAPTCRGVAISRIAGLVPKREREISLLSVTEIGTGRINHFCDTIGAMLKYTVILIPEDEGGYSVDVPALPGCCTQGETKEEAISMAKEAIELYLESCQAHDEAIPQESGIESLTVAVKEPVA